MSLDIFLVISSGDSLTHSAGQVSLLAGHSSDAGGDILLKTGDSSSSYHVGGSLVLAAGVGSIGGTISITGGLATDTIGGDVQIEGGTTLGLEATAGAVSVTGGSAITGIGGSVKLSGKIYFIYFNVLFILLTSY